MTEEPNDEVKEQTEFFEEDEPVKEVAAAFENGSHGVTSLPDVEPGRDRQPRLWVGAVLLFLASFGGWFSLYLAVFLPPESSICVARYPSLLMVSSGRPWLVLFAVGIFWYVLLMAACAYLAKKTGGSIAKIASVLILLPCLLGGAAAYMIDAQSPVCSQTSVK